MRVFAQTPIDARAWPDRRRSAPKPACLRHAIRRLCRWRAAAPRQKQASAPGCRGRAQPAPLRRARLRKLPRACRLRHSSRPFRPCRGRTPTLRRGAASRQAMPSPITPAPIMATRGRLPMDLPMEEMVVALNAAPFAGMTQTGSTGLISAAFAAAPHADGVIMGLSRPFGKGQTGPAMAQIARADQPDDQDHGGADQQRLAASRHGRRQSRNRSGRAPGRKRTRRNASIKRCRARSASNPWRAAECRCAACKSRCRRRRRSPPARTRSG